MSEKKQKVEVEHPSYYNDGGLECIEMMYEIDPNLAIYFLLGSMMKYLDRAGMKDAKEIDVDKAINCWKMAKAYRLKFDNDINGNL